MECTKCVQIALYTASARPPFGVQQRKHLLLSSTMFFCLPIFFGCQTKLKPDGEVQTPRVCPRCNNASVFATKSTTWFELFFIPVVPFSTKHIWFCNICQWRASAAPGGPEPPMVHGAGGNQSPGWNPPHQTGYQPSYNTYAPK
ncbi:hypothetical protein BD779DRAFT_1501130 [Infundibulicybe gibba]|nr:hypothetical protein BD779DRAFT_1501130 [Infundibulicybe gibba]